MRLTSAILLSCALAGAGCASKSAGPEPAPAMEAKPAMGAMKAKSAPAAEAPQLKAVPVDRTPIRADLSGMAFPPEPAELFGWNGGEGYAFWFTQGLGQVSVKVPADGEYRVTLSARCDVADGQYAMLRVRVDGAEEGPEVALTQEGAKDYSTVLALKAGERKIGVEFLNDLYKEGEYDLNLYVESLTLVREK